MDKVFIPDWMGTEQYKEVSSRSKGRSRMGFLRKTLRQLQKGLSSERLNEYYARQDGLLQHIDPRIKLIATISLILIAGLTRKLEILLGLWLLTLILMYFSRLPVLKMQLNIWAFIPLITLLIAVPGMFNLISVNRYTCGAISCRRVYLSANRVLWLDYTCFYEWAYPFLWGCYWQ